MGWAQILVISLPKSFIFIAFPGKFKGAPSVSSADSTTIERKLVETADFHGDLIEFVEKRSIIIASCASGRGS